VDATQGAKWDGASILLERVVVVLTVEERIIKADKFRSNTPRSSHVNVGAWRA